MAAVPSRWSAATRKNHGRPARVWPMQSAPIFGLCAAKLASGAHASTGRLSYVRDREDRRQAVPGGEGRLDRRGPAARGRGGEGLARTSHGPPGRRQGHPAREGQGGSQGGG